jgi:hypothetical protein
MESIRNSMDPKVKEKHEKEHEDSKKKDSRTTSHYQSDMNSPKGNQAEES